MVRIEPCPDRISVLMRIDTKKLILSLHAPRKDHMGTQEKVAISKKGRELLPETESNNTGEIPG